MNPLNHLNIHYTTLAQARYMTDLSITSENGQKIVALCWQARVPFLGHLISYIRHLVCDASLVERQLIELGQGHQEDFKLSLNNFLTMKKNNLNQDALTTLSKTYRVLQQLFHQINSLSNQEYSSKIDWEKEFFPIQTQEECDLELKSNTVKSLNQQKIKRLDQLLQNVDSSCDFRIKTTPFLKAREEQKTVLNLQKKLNESLHHLQLLSPVEGYFKLCEWKENNRFDDIKTYLDDFRVKEKFPTNYEMLQKAFAQLQPNAETVQEKDLALYLEKYELASVVELMQKYRQLDEKIKPIVEEKKKHLKEERKKIVNAYLNNEGSIRKKGTLFEDSHDSWFKELLMIPQIPLSFWMLAWDDVVTLSEIEEAKKDLSLFETQVFDLTKVKKIHRLFKLSEDSRNISIDYKDQKDTISQISEVYKEVKEWDMNAWKGIRNKVLKASEDIGKCEELERYKKLKEYKVERKELLTMSRTISQSEVLKNYLPTLLEEFNSLAKQIKLGFSQLSPQVQERFLSTLSLKELYAFAKKSAKKEPFVEKEMARRVPSVYGDLLNQIKNALMQYPQTEIAREKLTQMEEDTKTQVCPTNLVEAFGYLKNQQETLPKVLALVPSKVIEEIELPCLDVFLEKKDSSYKKTIKDLCSCPIHQGLIKARFWSDYYALQTKFSVRSFDKIFNEILKEDPIMAAQLVLWNPRGTKEEHESAKRAINEIYKQTTPPEAISFVNLPGGSMKTSFIRLASRLYSKKDWVLLREELQPFNSNWKMLEIQLEKLGPQEQKNKEFKKIELAAKVIVTSDYFKLNHSELYKKAVEFIGRRTPALVNDAVTKILPFLSDPEESLDSLLPLRLVNKEWCTLVDQKIASETPKTIYWLIDNELNDEKESEFYSDLKALADDFKSEIAKLEPPKTLNEAHIAWKTISKPLVLFMEAFCRKTNTPFSKTNFKCTKDLLMRNLGGWNWKHCLSTDPCLIHSEAAARSILKQYEKYKQSPETFKREEIEELLRGLEPENLKQMAKVAVVAYASKKWGDSEFFLLLQSLLSKHKFREKENADKLHLVYSEDTRNAIFSLDLEEIKNDSFWMMMATLACSFDSITTEEDIKIYLSYITDSSLKTMALQDAQEMLKFREGIVLKLLENS